jgi:hypothetical protein
VVVPPSGQKFIHVPSWNPSRQCYDEVTCTWPGMDRMAFTAVVFLIVLYGHPYHSITVSLLNKDSNTLQRLSFTYRLPSQSTMAWSGTSHQTE